MTRCYQMKQPAMDLLRRSHLTCQMFVLNLLLLLHQTGSPKGNERLQQQAASLSRQVKSGKRVLDYFCSFTLQELK